MTPEQGLYEFLADAPLACHEIDVSGQIVYVNDAECRLLALPRDQIVGRPVWDFVAPEEQATSRQAVGRKMAGEAGVAALRTRLRSTQWGAADPGDP